MSNQINNNAASAASLLSLSSFKTKPIDVAVRPFAPIPPGALPPAKIINPVPRMSQASQTRHRQISVVCDSFLLINSLLCVLVSQRHRQNSTYRTRRRARACVISLFPLILKFHFIEKCLCHCAKPIMTRLCVCDSRLCPSVTSVTPGGSYGYQF